MNLETFKPWQRPFVVLLLIVSVPFVLAAIVWRAARRRVRAYQITVSRLSRHGRH